MNSVDKLIIEWFNTDFGLGFSGGIVGNLCLILLSFVMTFLSMSLSRVSVFIFQYCHV